MKDKIYLLFPGEADGFFTMGEPEQASLYGMRIVAVRNFVINKSEYGLFQTERKPRSIDIKDISQVKSNLFTESKTYHSKILLIDANGKDPVQAFRAGLRHDPEFVIVGIFDETTPDNPDLQERIERTAEEGHFMYVVHGTGSKLKERAS